MLTGILQPTHLIILLIVALLFLGPKRLPDAGRALGQGLREFKTSITAAHEDDPQIAPAPTTGHQDTPPGADASAIHASQVARHGGIGEAADRAG